MLDILIATALLGLIPVPEEPETVPLFAQEAWYRTQTAKETDFVGVLTRFDRTGPAIGRFNPFRLILDGDRREIREVYLGSKPELLQPYLGKRVKLIGKPVDLEVEGRTHREIWPARLVVLDEPTAPRRVSILAEHRLYKTEKGTEKILEGTLRKEEKGGYVLEMKTAREEMTLYPDAGDPLAPFVGKYLRLSGKQISGQVGPRTFQHTLPAWIEVIEPAGPGMARATLQRQIDLLRKQLEFDEQQRRDLEQQLNQPIADPTLARQLKLQLAESITRGGEIRAQLAGMENQSRTEIAPGSRQELEQTIAAQKQKMEVGLVRFKEIQKKLLNVDALTPAEFIALRRAELQIKQDLEREEQRLRELQQQLERLNQAPLEELKRGILRQRELVQALAQESAALQAKIAAAQGQVPPEEVTRLTQLAFEVRVRFASEQKQLAVLEARYQEALQR